MKAFIAVLVILLVLVVAGWLTIGRSGGKPAAILETERIEMDAERAAEKGKELLHETTEKVEELREENAAVDRNADASNPADRPERDNRRQPVPVYPP
jgi:sRNA-binding protein